MTKRLKIGLFFLLILSQIASARQDDGKSFIYAKKLMQDSLYDLAAEQFHEFATDNPLHPRAPESLLLAGKCYYQNNQFQSAVKEFTSLISLFPDADLLDQAHFELAKSFYFAGNVLAAAKTFHQVFIFYPKSKLAKVSLLKSAEKFFFIKEYDQSKRIIYDLQESFPNSVESFEAKLILIDIFINTKQFDRAETEISNLLALTENGLTNAKALLRKGHLLKITDRFEDSEQSYNALIEKYESNRAKKDWSQVINQASYELADIYFQKGLYKIAIETLEKIPQNERQPNELLLLARSLIKEKDYKSAVSALEPITQIQSDSLNFIEANYLRGISYSNLKDYFQANRAFREVIDFCQQNNIIENQYLELSFAELTKNYTKNGKFEAAIGLLKNYSTKFPGKPNIDQINFKIANIYEKNLLESDRAIRIYDDILANFPESKFVDDAQFAIARCYEKKGDFEQAETEFNRFLSKFPASPYIDEARKAIFRIRNYFPTRKNLNQTIMQLIENSLETRANQAEKFEQLAEINFNDLKKYEKAVSYWRKALSTAELSSADSSKIYYFIGKSHLFLAQKDRAELNYAEIDSAKRYFSLVLTFFPLSDWADDAEMENITIFQISNSDTDTSTGGNFKQLLSNFLTHHPKSIYKIPINIKLAESMLKQGISTSQDSLDVANCISFVQANSGDEAEKAHANLLQAKLFFQTKNDSAAQELLSSLAQDKNNQHLCETIDLLAKLSLEQNITGLEKVLSSFVENHFYSPCVDKIKAKLGSIYLDQNQPHSALKLFQEMYLEKTQNDFFGESISKKDTLPQEILFQLGNSYQQLNEREKAIEFFQKYLRLFPEGKFSEKCLFSLGHLFSSREPDEKRKAIDYFKRLINYFPKSQLADSATVKIGDLFFQLKDYGAASSFYSKIIQKPEPSVSKAYSEAQNIICNFKQGKISTKLPQIKAFKEKYGKKHLLVADLMLEAGSHFLKEKDFKNAEDIFKKVKSDYKNSYQEARADFLLGKLYFILNKDEDALKILTKLIANHPDQEKIVADAYIALGNFYYLQAKQVQNALFAYQKVTHLKKTSVEQEKLAKNNIIRCYTDMRMREQAVAAIYEYADRFPDAEDLFEKKILLGILYYELHEYDRALAMLKKLKFEADIENEPRIQYWIGECYAGKGDFKRAVSEYLKVAYLSRPTKLNWGVTAQFQAGVAYIKAGEPERAKEIFAKIVKKHGKNSVFGKPAQAKIDEINEMLNKNQRN